MPLNKKEKRFYHTTLFIALLVFGFLTYIQVSDLFLVLDCGWDGKAGTILLPQQATIYYSITAILFVLNLFAIILFALKRKRTTVVILCVLFIVLTAVSNLIYYLLTNFNSDFG